MLLSLEFFIFLNFWMEKIAYWDFGILAQTILSSFSQFTKQLEAGALKFPCFHIQSDCEDCISGSIYVLGRGQQSFCNNFVLFNCWKHFLQTSLRVKIAKFSWGCTAATIKPSAVSWNKSYLIMPCVTQILLDVR